MLSAQRATRFPSSMRSPLEGVPLFAWQRFVAALELDDLGHVRPMDAVSERGGFGSYDLRPKRLADLGYVTDLRRIEGQNVRQIYTCRFLLPFTKERFLADPRAQLEALGKSMAGYQQDLKAGRIHQPEGLSLAGTLSILHCGGRGALERVLQAGLTTLFPHTRAVFERAKGAF